MKEKNKSHAFTYAAQRVVLSSEIVKVETDITIGIHSFSIIGLPEKEVVEARDRVSAAIRHSGFVSPKQQNQKIVISLAPGELKKTGTLFDTPIALSYLLAKNLISFDINKKMFIGELSLDGSSQKADGILPLIVKARDDSFEEVYIPEQNKEEAELIEGIKIIPYKNLKELIQHLKNEITLKPIEPKYSPETDDSYDITLASIKGQDSVKRAMTIAAAGGHNIALYGPPGTGKTLLAKSIVSILPKLNKDECVEVTSIHSINSINFKKPITTPPFRSPHHSSSYASIVGGGANLNPGEISLAHRGVLFLDEFPEFDRRVIESLRQPLEEKVITISRSSGSAVYPASCVLVLAFNLCPCGNTGTNKACNCSIQRKLNYYRKLSGPIADRIDMWVGVEASSFEKLEEKTSKKDLEAVEKIREKVSLARNIQNKRGMLNAEMDVNLIEKLSNLTDEAKEVLIASSKKLDLSPRGYHRTIKCAKTIADLEGSDSVEKNHILEAIGYRNPPQLLQ